MAPRYLWCVVWLSLVAMPVMGQHSTTNGGTPTGFAITPAEPKGPDSFTANPPSPPPSGPDSFTANPKPKKPDSTDPRLPEPRPEKPAAEVPDRRTATDDTAPTTPARPDAEASDSASGSEQPVETLPRNQGSLITSLDQGSAFQPLSATTAPAGEEEAPYEPGQVLVQTDNIAQARAIQNALAADGYRVRGRRFHRSLGFVVMTLRTPADKPVAQALAELEAQFPDSVVEANHRYQPLATEDTRTYGHRLVGWETGRHCGQGIRIGMIDTPVQHTHPAFRAASVRTDSVLPAGAAAAHPDHGTAVAALLVGADESGFNGLLPGAELLAINAFRGSGRKMDTNVTLLLAALDRLLGDTIQVLNLSFGGPANRLLGKALDRFIEQGIAVVAAAGNDRGQNGVYPAGFEGVIAVTALDARRKALRNASRGGYIDFAAPGVDIWSAKAEGGGRFYSGTSFATPYVTAMLALAGQHTGDVASALQRLRGSVEDLGESGQDPVFGHGLVRWDQGCGTDA